MVILQIEGQTWLIRDVWRLTPQDGEQRMALVPGIHSDAVCAHSVYDTECITMFLVGGVPRVRASQFYWYTFTVTRDPLKR
eukprot:7524028-Pyramimonas_sp.AAC.1